MSSEDMEEKDMVPAAAGEEMAVPGEEGVRGDEGERLVKSAANEELNLEVAQDVVPGDVDYSIVAVAGSVDGSVEAPVSGAAVSGDFVDATEKVESWDLSEAVAKNVQEEDSKPKISEEELGEGVGAENESIASIDSIEDSVGEEPVSVFPDVEEKAGDSEHAVSVTEVPSTIAGGEDVNPEIPSAGSSEKVRSEAVDAPVEEVDEVVEATTSVGSKEEPACLEAVPSPSDDVEEKPVEVNSRDVSEEASILPSESAENEDVRPKLPAEEISDYVDGEAVDAPVDSEGLLREVDDKVVEPSTSAEADEGSVEPAQPESVSVPASDVEGKSVEMKSEDTSEANTLLPSESADNKDVSPEHPAEGPSDNVDSEALEAPVDSEGPDAQVIDEVAEPTTSAETHEGSLEPESVSAPVDVENKSVEVKPEDTSEADTELISESAENKDISRELPAATPSDNVDSEALAAPADSEVLEPEMVDKVVEPPTSAEADEGSLGPEPVSEPAGDVEEKSMEVNSEETGEANAALLPTDGAENEDVSSELEPAQGSAEKIGYEVTRYAPVEEVHEVVEANNIEPREESAEPESVFVTPHDVEEKSFEVDSGDVREAITGLVSADSEAVGSELPAEESADNISTEELEPEAVHEVAEPETSAEPVEESAEPEFVSVPPHNIEDKSVDLNSEDVTETITESATTNNEEVSSELPTEESADNVSGDALDAQAPHKVAEPTNSEDFVKELAEPESVSAPSGNVEDESIEDEVTTASESADNEDVSPKPSVEEPPDNVGTEVTLYAPVEEVHEVVEATIGSEPEEDSAESEFAPESSDDIEDDFVMVKRLAEASTELDSADDEIVSPELPAQGSADNVSTQEIEPDAFHEVVEPTTSAEADEASAEPESVSAPVDVKDKPVQVKSEDSHELSAEASADKLNAPIEEIGKIEDAATNAKADEVSASLGPMAPEVQLVPEEVEPKVAAPETEDNIMATSTPLPAEEEHKQSEVSHEGSTGNGGASIGLDMVPDTKESNAAEHTSEEALASVMSEDAPNNPHGLSIEEPSDLFSESHEKSLTAEGVALVDRCIQVEELPRQSAAESQNSVSADAEGNAGDEEGIVEGGDIIKEGSLESQSATVEDASQMLRTEMTHEEAAHAATQPVEDVSHLLQTAMTDEEVKFAAAHHPESNVAPEESEEDETPALESENSRGEPSIPPAEFSGASQANKVETVSREFNDGPTTSIVRESDDESHDAVTSEQVTPYLATALAMASGEKGNSPDAAISNTTPLRISSPPPVVENVVAPRSYNLDEVAHNLHDAAAKTLEDAKSSNIGDGQTSVVQSVAQIVLDESSKTGDSSEYISGVVQDVAQLAQTAAQSDPNILPDTVARVFDGETAASTANEASQAEETTSLGNMFSLFIVWCVSLCASHISSKDMPAPALKLAAEEVAAVLHSNAPSQPAPSHETASSNH